MLEKFISIKNIGRFRNCNPKGDVAFRKLTLLFAENGQGKTTLCAILRSLQSGKYEFICERKTLGVSEPCSIEIRLDGNTISYSNHSWSATYPNIAIFDSVFVHDNVYAGDYVEHEHKKNLYRVIVGKQGVALAQKVDDLDKEIREANSNIRAKKEAVSKFLPNGFGLNAYLAWQPVDSIENKIIQKSSEIANQQRALDKADEIQKKGLFAKIQLPSFPTDFSTILAKKLEDVIANAETRVRQQVARHQMGHQGESWLSQGLGYIENERCPFCGQDIRSNDLIAAYRSYFNVAYESLKEEVGKLSQRITSTIGEPSLNSIQQVISGNLTLVEFWKQFTKAALPDLTFDKARQKYARLREMALALAKKKQETPTEPVSLDDDFRSALRDVESFERDAGSYNTAVDSCNKRISELKTSVQKGGDLTSLKKGASQICVGAPKMLWS